MRKVARGAAALVAMATGLVATPVALASWGRLPSLPLSLRGDDGPLVLILLTIAGWLAWAAFLATTAGEVVRLVGRHRFIVRLPLLGGLQGLTASLVLAVTALAGPTPAPGTATDAHPVTAPEEPPAPDSPWPTVPTAVSRPVATGEVGPSCAQSVPGSYLVAAGDDLWTVAATLLGDGSRWRDLAAANPVVLADPTQRLKPGTRLVLPAAPSAQRTRVVEVRAGDTLSGLAAEHLGKASSWPRLAAANERLISDPDHIEVGWRLALPAAERRSQPAAERRAQSAGGTALPACESSDPTAGEVPHPTPSGIPVTPAASPAPVPGPTAPATASPGVHLEDGSQDSALIGTMGTLAAVGLVGGWELRRLRQQRTRAPGRRAPQPDESLLRFHAALGRHGTPDRAKVLDWSLRAIGRHCFENGLQLPQLAQARLTSEELTFEWVAPASGPPLGFSGDADRWTVVSDSEAPGPVLTHPCAFPALVSLGTNAAGETVMIDLEHSGVLGVAATSAELQAASLASMAVELACAPWAAETDLTVVGGDSRLTAAAGGDDVTHVDDAREALASLRKCVAGRREALRGTQLRSLRVDPDRAEAVTPRIFLFQITLDDATRTGIDSLLAGEPCGVGVVVPVEDGSAASWSLFGDQWEPRGRLGNSPSLAASGIPAATRDAVTALYAVAEGETAVAAPWWNEDHRQPERRSREPVDIVNLSPTRLSGPEVTLIGPVDLVGAAGTEPARSRTQLIELCSWLLEFPGHTASQMAAGLGIAESTRRSNMSRLRTWLGTTPDGEPYLPDAYSGRIRLRPEVTSDVQKLRLLTADGVNRLGERDLVAVLDLVRGDLLADAVPGQWFWAEELRSDVRATLRDAGLVLVDLALAAGKLDLARWAAGRALAVAPDDELLLCARVRTEHAAGNRPAVQRLVSRLTHQARRLGVDLMPDTVMLCQQVLEGRPRQRDDRRPERVDGTVAPLRPAVAVRRA